MEMHGNMWVFVILGVAFAAVGVHLVLWSRRQSSRIENFARSHGLGYEARDSAGHLEREVNSCVALEEPGLARAFDRFRDLVSLNGGKLFRAVELLDLNPWGDTENTHQARTAVFFDAPHYPAGIFSVTPTLAVEQRYPRNQSAANQVRALLERASVRPPPCPLSLTLMRGHGLAYLEPTMVGSLTEEHLRYLVEFVSRFPSGA